MKNTEKNILVTNDVINEIREYANNGRHESGGIIGKNKNGIITKFCPDESPQESTPFSYSPNIEFLEHIINDIWIHECIEFAGFVHSHMHNGSISEDDILYIRKIINNNNYESLICGILNVENIKYEDAIQWYNISKNNIELLH